MMLAELFEILMLVSFGFAWPTSILKSLKSKTTKGKSLVFLIVVFLGYLFGVCAKFAAQHVNYVLIFYAINLVMVSIDISLYFRNRHFDREIESEAV